MHPFPHHPGKRFQCRPSILLLCILLTATSPVLGLETQTMRAPHSILVKQTKGETRFKSAPSPLQSVLLRGVRFFQQWVSPIDGSRCSFTPTCSQFGYETIRNYGVALGIIMTSDRLMRCTIFTEAGMDYRCLPNATLSDPVANNLLIRP